MYIFYVFFCEMIKWPYIARGGLWLHIISHESIFMSYGCHKKGEAGKVCEERNLATVNTGFH